LLFLLMLPVLQGMLAPSYVVCCHQPELLVAHNEDSAGASLLLRA
jgi:hypothetical protein